MDPRQIRAKASNVKGGANPPFTLDDFKTLYPHFFGGDVPAVPDAMYASVLTMAHGAIKASRYKSAWRLCMGLFVAHFITLYLESAASGGGDGGGGVVESGKTKGNISSMSVDGVAVAFDSSQTLSDLDGFAGWKSTNYGVQLATIAKMYSMGGMYVP